MMAMAISGSSMRYALGLALIFALQSAAVGTVDGDGPGTAIGKHRTGLMQKWY